MFRFGAAPIGRSIGCHLRVTGLRYISEGDFRASEDLAKERYDMRSDEDITKKRARLLYQSRKRGMLENGVILASFADKFLNKFDPEQLDQYDRLINLPTNDWDIFYWATRTKPTPAEFETPVMKQLREHINSKVSNTSILDGKDPDDILFPAVKKHYELNIDPRKPSLTNFSEELFDNRIKRFPSGKQIVRMTDWRKKEFVRRIKRTIPSFLALKSLGDDKKTEVVSQKAHDKKIANEQLINTDLMDTVDERTMKHHKFLQHLLGSDLTDDALEYDEEAEAWANIIWHRSYGSADISIAPSKLNCSACGSQLHCCDPGLSGYMPKEIFATLGRANSNVRCQKCKFAHTYSAHLGVDVDRDTYERIFRGIREDDGAVICLLVDLTDLPSGIFEGIRDLVGNNKCFLVVGNKLDLLPYDGPNMIERVTTSLRDNLQRLRPGESNLKISDVMVMSGRTGFGVENLVSKLLDHSETDKNIYLVGCSNSGKSTLFNALLQSDLSAVRNSDLISRVSLQEWPNTSLKTMKFPINPSEGWEIELKKRKSERAAKDTARYERALEGTTVHRQAQPIHMSMLIDRLSYPPFISKSSDSIVKFEREESSLRLAEDHPLKKVEKREPLSATEDKFAGSGFVYYTPSISSKDQIHDLLTNDERLEVYPHETIIPRKYSLRPLSTVFVAGLARLDLLTCKSYVTLSIFASRYLPVHVIPTRDADRFYHTFLGSSYLGVPFGDEQRLKAWPRLVNSKEDFLVQSESKLVGASDIVLGSVGWALVNMGPDQDCIIRAYTPEGRGIYKRTPALIPYATRMGGRKIKNTPLFEHPHHSVSRLLV